MIGPCGCRSKDGCPLKRGAAGRIDTVEICGSSIALLGVVKPDIGGIEAGVKLLEICPGTKIVLVTESVPPENTRFSGTGPLQR
jgi:hypothetical protein